MRLHLELQIESLQMNDDFKDLKRMYAIKDKYKSLNPKCRIIYDKEKLPLLWLKLKKQVNMLMDMIYMSNF